MSAAEKHDGALPFWPIAMSLSMALAFTGVSEAQMTEWRRRGVVRFRPRGPNGALITERAQLEEAVRQMFGDVSADMDFGDGDD